MKTLYSIPVHECPECVEQMCQGIMHFDKNALIVLHVSKNQNIDHFQIDNVVINPEQFETLWGWDFSRIHVSNYLFARKKFEISYVIFLSSNCLMLKDPSDFIKNYDCGFSEHNHDGSKITPPYLIQDYQLGWAGDLYKTESFQGILNELNTTKRYGCVIDASYVNSLIMDKISYLYEKYFYYQISIHHSLEEQLFPTIACNLTTKISDSLMHMGNQNLEGFKRLIEKENVFFNKRIPRDMNNELRKFYNTIIK